MFSSPEDVSERLKACGYIADFVMVTTIYLAAKLHKPLLLEGPAGTGKTQLAYAIAVAAQTTVERLQCYEGINEEVSIGKFNAQLQRLWAELKAKSSQIDWASLKSEIHSRDFFQAGPLLTALENEKSCVLLIDELDKVDQKFEAQSFKRSAACFGLGRYLYYFEGVWVDLDERKRPKTVPRLPDWATPEGWLRGLRPTVAGDRIESSDSTRPESTGVLVAEIESLAQTLGRGLYRGLLRDLARVWNPREILDVGTQRKVLEHMRKAERGMQHLQAALDRTGTEVLLPILKSMGIGSLERVDNLETLKKIVDDVERAVSDTPYL